MGLQFLQSVLLYQWLEDSLRSGEKVSEDSYYLNLDLEGDNTPDKSLVPKEANINSCSYKEPSHNKKIRSSAEDSKNMDEESKEKGKTNALYEGPSTPGDSDDAFQTLNLSITSGNTPDALNKDVSFISQ